MKLNWFEFPDLVRKFNTRNYKFININTSTGKYYEPKILNMRKWIKFIITPFYSSDYLSFENKYIVICDLSLFKCDHLVSHWNWFITLLPREILTFSNVFFFFLRNGFVVYHCQQLTLLMIKRMIRQQKLSQSSV